ncbi:NUDIX hydrolase [Paenisporosarcina sp. OV554]|uniref:NUDIX hydrolase n=1 Tax=Paenisporosarcina sp. OV554 TaxID=2135694 RepID=UPI000D3988FC|nr:NUDIX hydrolase [Paenisporosarcina sp. OV554]PUB11425.1 ADP-ribose pyrophosphatase YjhB (NUDIX family) [Paenisporosarcina sp. OV554]
MLFRRKSYTINPDMYDTFNHFFHTFLLPNQLTHGASLVGRWVNESRTEIMAMWAYRDLADFEHVDAAIRESEHHQTAQNYRQTLPSLFENSSEDFMESTGNYSTSPYIVAVSGFIQNEAGQVLLVRNEHRSNTYEMPGGRVEPGESMKDAVAREVLEETGIHAEIGDMVGVYQNVTTGVLCLVYRGKWISGSATPNPGETIDAQFVELNETNVADWITREHFATRVFDAMNQGNVAYESYEVRPYRLLERVQG